MNKVIYRQTTRGSSLDCCWDTTRDIMSATFTLFRTEYVTARQLPVPGFIGKEIDLESYDRKTVEVQIVSTDESTAFPESGDYRLEVTARTNNGNHVFIAIISVE